jgi:hypothetical protein
MGYLLSVAQTSNDIYVCGLGVYSQNTQEGQQIYLVGYTSSHLNSEVKQHWGRIILGRETLQGIPGSAVNAVVSVHPV